jgi:hypothetical protein
MIAGPDSHAYCICNYIMRNCTAVRCLSWCPGNIDDLESGYPDRHNVGAETDDSNPGWGVLYVPLVTST